ncbi:MAG: hypothetical protein WA996_02160 [Candidatus Promineifilaceae bacterium]
MKTSWKPLILLLIIPLLITLAACGLTEEEIAQTAQALGPGQIAGLSATIEALPAEQIAILEQMAVNAGLPTLSPNQKAAVIATVDAARATATAVGASAAAGERVNATAAPNVAPIIVYFFASAPNQAQATDGIRYFLSWTTQKANRVEIFGTVMDNPVEGSWPVYNDSNHWVLWAANDQAWVESFLDVVPDQDTGATLQNVTVNSRNITLTFRDPQFVDGDQIAVDVNNVRILNGFVTTGRHVSIAIALQSGANTISIETQSGGVTPPMVAEITTSNVTAGPAVQQTRGMNPGERQSFTITAP